MNYHYTFIIMLFFMGFLVAEEGLEPRHADYGNMQYNIN